VEKNSSFLHRDVRRVYGSSLVARALTKIYEENFIGEPEVVLAHFTNHPDHVRGEFVVVAHGA
jgi:16S rRNA C1402 (ribose-2'-O) methylase RsmI